MTTKLLIWMKISILLRSMHVEVDHIIELQDGGQDIASNLQALCPQCHKEKTRLNRLHKSSIFRDSVMADYERYILFYIWIKQIIFIIKS